MKDFNEWLSAKGINPEEVTPAQLPIYQSAWRAELNGGDAPPKPAPAADQVKVDSSIFDQKMNAIEAEDARVKYIHEATIRSCENSFGNTEKIKNLRSLCDAAVADKTMTVEKFQLALMRADRFMGPLDIPGSGGQQATESVIEAAVCRRAGLQDLEKHFDVRTLEASERQFKRGLGLQQLLHHSAQRHGWRGQIDVESSSFLRHAFGMAGDGIPMPHAGSTGPSTYSLPTVLGNVANKFLKAGWLSVDMTWSRLCYKRSVNDFKTITTARLNGATIYRTLAPGGEIKHATLTESTYTNRASTYAIMLGITREDRINDDLGAFAENGRHMGRGAGLKINDLFWTVFLNNSAFFAAGNNNVSTGAGSALGTADGAAINAAERVFIIQTDPNGYPIALAPRIMLAPPTLANTARRWMGSFGFTPSGTTGLGDSNIFQGRYSVETSPYMENSSYTGNSAAAWYLLADPQDEAVIEGVAVNGRWEPTVEFGESDFNQLGEAWRGYIDVGFAFKEPRAGVRSAGS